MYFFGLIKSMDFFGSIDLIDYIDVDYLNQWI